MSVMVTDIADKLSMIDYSAAFTLEGRRRSALGARAGTSRLNRPGFRSYREPCPAGAGWPDSWSA